MICRSSSAASASSGESWKAFSSSGIIDLTVCRNDLPPWYLASSGAEMISTELRLPLPSSITGPGLRSREFLRASGAFFSFGLRGMVLFWGCEFDDRRTCGGRAAAVNTRGWGG